jgi:HEXXH motif-containing protein
MIHWRRMVEPQPDHYDTAMTLRLAGETTTALRPQPYRRTAPAREPTIFDGSVAVRHVYRELPEFCAGLGASEGNFLDAPTDHPNLRRAAELIRCWPTVFEQCQQLLEAVHPAIDVRIPFRTNDLYRGSNSHSYERRFGTLWATIHCQFGLANAVVHEMAHQKLRALGVSVESAMRIVANDPTERYESPVIKDRLRPMMAVLHAEYSFLYVTELELHIVRSMAPGPTRRALMAVLATNRGRISQGLAVLRRHLRTDAEGGEFAEALFRWADRLIAEAAPQTMARAPGGGRPCEHS